MVETNVKRADKTLNKGEATLDPSRKEVMYKTTGGTTIGVGHDAHHDDTGVVQMAKTIGKGEMPSNVQLENTIEKAKVSLDQTSPTLTAHGRKLAEDAKEVLESAEQLLENKNPDESLQRIVKEANLLSREGVEQGAEQAKEMYNDQYDSTGLMRSTIQNVRDLVVFLLRSSDFRGFMLDSLELFQSILRDIDRKHGDSLMEGIKKDANREDTRMNETKRAGESLKEDIKQGNLGDEEKKESLEDRFESLLFKISENPQYHQAINNIFALVDQLQARFEKFEPSTQLDRNDRSSLIIDESWNILSKFVDERDLVLYRDFFWELFNELKYDMEARQFFWDLKQYMLKLATNPDEITDNYRKEQAKDFVNRAKALFRSGQFKYQDRFNRLFELTFTILNQIRNDADTQKFVDSLGQLAQDFFTDDQGKPDLFVTQESIQQLRDMIIPILEKQLENVPLPMIEGTNDKYDWKLEDITLYGKDLLPDTFDLKMTNNLVLGHKHTDDKYVSKLKVSGKKIKLALNDFKFWYHRKTVPKLEDSGIADLKMLGNGLSFKLVWKLWITENKPLTIKLDSIKVWIDKLDIDIKKSNHSFINKLATKLFAGTIKRRVGDAIVEQMRSNIDPLNDQLNSFFRRERDNRRMMSTANEKLKEVYDANIGGKLKDTAENIKEKLTPDRGVESEEKKEFSSGGTGVEHYEFSSGGTFEKSTILKDTSAVSGRYANVSKDTPLEKETIIKQETFSTENPFEAQEGKYHGQWKAKLPK